MSLALMQDQTTFNVSHVNQLIKHCPIKTLGYFIPRVLCFWILVAVCSFGSVFTAESALFDLDLLSASYGKFKVVDPQQQSWSTVESGVDLAYRGFTWHAERLRFLNKIVPHYSKPLIEQALFESAATDFVKIDSRDYADLTFPMRGIFCAQQIELNSRLMDDALEYQVSLMVLEKVNGNMRMADNQLMPFMLKASRLAATTVLYVQAPSLREPILKQCQLSGEVNFFLEQEAQKRGLECKADSIQLVFAEAGYLSEIRLEGSPAVLNQYQADQCRSYSSNSLQVQLSTVGTIKSILTSSDVKFRNFGAQMQVGACILPMPE